MAVEVVKTIGASGDYSTIASWWAARNTAPALNTGDTFIGEIIDTGTLAGYTFNGTTTRTGNCILRAANAVAYNFSNPSAAHVTISSGATTVKIDCSSMSVDSNLTIEGIEIISTSTTVPCITTTNYKPSFFHLKKSYVVGGMEGYLENDNAANRSSVTSIENCVFTGSYRSGILSKTAHTTGSFSTTSTVIVNCNTAASIYSYGIQTFDGVNGVVSSVVSIGNTRASDIGSGTTASYGAADNSFTTFAITDASLSDFTDSDNGIWTSLDGGKLYAQGSNGSNIGLNLVANNVLLITSPVVNEFVARDLKTNTGTIAIAGTFSGPLTPSNIEARWGETGSYTTLTMGSGTFSGTIPDQPSGNNTLYVQYEGGGMTSSIENVAIGAKFLVWGQSNFSGRATSIQTYTAQSGYFKKYTSQDANDTTANWEKGSDPWDYESGQGTNGSVFPEIANRFVAALGIPIGIVGIAHGSTQLSQWVSGQVYNNSILNHITNSGGATGFEGIISWIGESDASNGTDESTFKANYTAIINQLETLTGAKSLLVEIPANVGTQDYDNVRQWINDLNSLDNVVGICTEVKDYYQKIHYESNQETNDAAASIYRSLELAFFTSDLVPTISGIPDGTYTSTVLSTSSEVLYTGNATWTSGTTTFVGLPTPKLSDVQGFVIDNKAITEDAAYFNGSTT